MPVIIGNTVKKTEEKAEVKELSKTFRKKVVKSENKTRTGKLY